MDLNSKIFITGHTYLVGSAIRRRLEILGYSHLLLRTPDELDLTRQDAVEELFSWERPDYVFLTTANSGDSVEGNSSPAESLYQSLTTEFNIIASAYQAGAKRLLFLGTSCIYPQWARQLLDDAHLLTGQMDDTNRVHTISKITGVELCRAYNRQHGCRFLAVMPGNYYGRGHAYDLHHSSVIPAMIVKLHHAKLNGESSVVLPGAGNLRRGFLYSDDLANACISLINLNDSDFATLLSNPSGPLINVDCEEDLTIRELAELAAEVVMFKGELHFERDDSDDNAPKSGNASRSQTLRWRSGTSLKERLRQAYSDFLSQTAGTERGWYDSLSLLDNHETTLANSDGH